MAILRYEPWNSIEQLHSDINKILEKRLQDDNSTVESSQWCPLVDIFETPHQFILHADIPGVDPNSINVSMEHDMLTIRGEKKADVREDNKNILRSERLKGRFYRRFSLPDTADSNNISAQSSCGVLEVIIPKREKAQPRKIEVTARH